jgi:ABC-type branched-subunit amino acid transport system ATPase component
MNFFYQGFRGKPKARAGELEPYVVLTKDAWNDFGHHTSYNLTLFDGNGTSLFEGSWRILNINDIDTASQTADTILPPTFSELESVYCSLAPTIESYRKLKHLGFDIYHPFLKGLNDVAYSPELANNFEDLKAFKESLLRESDQITAFREVRSIFGKGEIFRVSKFTFSCRVDGASAPHRVSFDFTNDNTDLHRVFCLIGQNGTGKTQFLAKLALSLSGQVKANSEDAAFLDDRPSFRKVICISYSVFDDFERPTKGRYLNSYQYHGIRGDNDKLLSRQKMTSLLRASYEEIENDEVRHPLWVQTIETLLPDLVVAQVDFDLTMIDKSLSSGQRILVNIMTRLIANIELNSILLLDEPELHLHPEMFAALIRSLSGILKMFDSCAIVATHSPLLLQETWSRQVRVFKRQGTYPVVHELDSECFGDTLSDITSRVFAVDGEEQNFRAHLQVLLQKFSFEEIEQMFKPHGLPLLAKAYLLSIKPKTNV